MYILVSPFDGGAIMFSPLLKWKKYSFVHGLVQIGDWDHNTELTALNLKYVLLCCLS